MRIKNLPYTCPRCGYTCPTKWNMYRHFHRDRICAANITDVDLTDSIKEKVLTGRIYHPPPKVEYPTSSNITNIQQINTFMNVINDTMTPVEKIQKYAKYKDVHMIPLDEELNDKFTNIKYKLRKAYENQSTSVYKHELKIGDFNNMIDEISQSKEKDFNDFNIIYDSEMNKISFLDDDGEWKASLEGQALYDIVYMIQDNYYDEYEIYLIRKIKRNNPYDAQCAKELLLEYYKFISVFDLPPFCVKDDTNFFADVPYGGSMIKEEFYPMYCEVKNNMKSSEKRNLYKTVVDIIKRNSAKNIKNLNTSIRVLFSSDQHFKRYLMEQESLCS